MLHNPEPWHHPSLSLAPHPLFVRPPYTIHVQQAPTYRDATYQPVTQAPPPPPCPGLGAAHSHAELTAEALVSEGPVHHELRFCTRCGHRQILVWEAVTP